MFGYNYKYEMRSDKNIIKLSPTKGTYAKAMLPSLLLWAGLGAMVALGSAASRNEYTHPGCEFNPEND